MTAQEIINELKANQKEYLASSIEPKKILEEIKKYIERDIDILSEAYKLDADDYLLADKLFSQFEMEEIEKSDTFKNDFGKVTKLYVPFGVLGVISNCNVYQMFRLMLLAVATKNGLIIDVTRNVGTIFMLVNEVNNALKKMGLKNVIEIYNHSEGTNLEEVEELDGIIYIGKRVNMERIKLSCDKPVIYSGSGNYEVYVDDNLDDELVKKASSMENMKIYSKKGIEIGQEVSGVEEAIARINESGNEYGVGIITESRENAKIFVNEVKSSNVFVNALPTLMDDSLDIKEKDLVYQKTVLVYE